MSVVACTEDDFVHCINFYSGSVSGFIILHNQTNITADLSSTTHFDVSGGIGSSAAFSQIPLPVVLTEVNANPIIPLTKLKLTKELKKWYSVEVTIG